MVFPAGVSEGEPETSLFKLLCWIRSSAGDAAPSPLTLPPRAGRGEAGGMGLAHIGNQDR